MKTIFRTLLAFACVAIAVAARAAESRPNVLFIAMDDLNDWVGCLGGNPQTRTPNIDRFAASGVLFRNAHCPAPACNPSRRHLLRRAPVAVGALQQHAKTP